MRTAHSGDLMTPTLLKADKTERKRVTQFLRYLASVYTKGISSVLLLLRAGRIAHPPSDHLNLKC
ncbi:hypothetical protein MetexDRAFT_1143 [Methylorubrum extorquens DSM 13060]|jgi:hypothetical protein|nr:hypothetical protein MetexDRAFT_1143 [Methylorubrum extorquens DSM 13060]MCP1545160.1 hypothetical protein [Methylorubrum extorquens]MCP1587492.1 hypothetical protein [Methylorubrum extorquens]